MKKLVIILSVLFTHFAIGQAPTQDLEVLMIGASHDYDPKIKQDLSGIHAKIRGFKPNAIFGEWLSPNDEKSIKNYWNKQNVVSRYERLKSRKSLTDNQLPDEIARCEKILETNPNDMQTRVDLAVAHYLNFDAGNGYFQMWFVGKHLQKNPNDKEIFEYARKMYFDAKIDSVHKVVKNYVDDEYDYIAHPMMMELGIKKMYPMDSQRWDEHWSRAWNNADSVLYANIEKYKTDSVSLQGKKVYDLGKLVKKRMNYLQKESIKNYGISHQTESLNGSEYTEWLFKINLWAEEYRELDFFPAGMFGEKFHWWWHRNNDMCHNTIDRSKANGFKRVVIVVGANHAAIMSNRFKEMGVKVININDAPMK